MRNRLILASFSGAAAVVLTGAAAFAVAGGTSAAVPGYAARVVVSDATGLPAQGCSGALVDKQWVLTSALCFTGQATPAATVSVAGVTRTVTEVLKHPDRAVVLARLSADVTTVEPAKLAGTPSSGETLTFAGWGRTATTWVPDQPHRADFQVTQVSGVTAELTAAAADAALCKGDAGAPLVRGSDVLALAASAGQRGCLDAPAGGTGAAQAVLVGDLSGWLAAATSVPADFSGFAKVQAGRFDGDAHPDVTAIEPATGKLWLFPGTSTGHVVAPRVEIGRAGWNAFSQIAAGDVTGDGLADLVTLESATGKLFLYPNTGQSGLSLPGARVEIGRSGWNALTDLITGDFTGDRLADVVAVESATGKLFLYPNTGLTGLSQLGARVEIGRAGWGAFGKLVAGDFTGDGLADILAVESATGKLFHYPNTGQSGLSLPGGRVEVASGWQGHTEVAAADFTGDGRQDLFALVSGAGWLYPLNGDGSAPISTRTQVRTLS
ncbi:FG-GAP-like repeat-containing protein [Actinoplanes sp. NBRC 101535]|uniref:FG-GAP-like repeat-containing protein n=1 Tax=Actinoplanes sp. NBRC 101535 TaxID=3032196 RepID=UPI0024A482ED|nr:FG-GAP-like repeat-containing protein [Actinoplanes sp. NBRC 101535]GLY06608.1 hypothetical protein Acsp01_69870 [Actinoplanes sp. NBRC 101535]